MRGIVLFSEAFPKTEFNPKLWWPLISELDGEAFCFSVQEFIKSTNELYPGSNPVAALIEKHDELVNQRRNMKQKRLTAETELERMERWKKESSPPPAKWREMMARLK